MDTQMVAWEKVSYQTHEYTEDDVPGGQLLDM